MRTIIRAAVLAICAFSPLAMAVQSAQADKASVAAFFSRYTSLSNAFDAKVADLYSDEAVIQLSSEGTERTMQFTGAQYKKILPRAIPLAKSTGDRNKFSNVRISTQGTGATIEAHRYNEAKCYTDRQYVMRVERQPDGGYLIVEERAHTQSQSSCQ
jgi:hypothetical protein